MRGPRLMPAKPRARAASSSASLSPPSGPLRNKARGCGKGLGRWVARGLSSARHSSSPGAGSAASQADNGITGSTCSGTLRPLCSAAAMATPCQWARFLSARSPARRSTERSDTRGWSAAAPSSVAFSTRKSIRSLAGMTTASVTARASSRCACRASISRTRTSLRPMAVTSACHSGPLPSNRVNASPGCRRSTCTCRAAPGGRAMSPSASGAASGVST
mmetsp:Transcript_1412/g.4210  ORF Transcript_1412/g.4210 Transcript_1412/m.4210 type:complete len:219 (-) Transcript_1412:298-954(-)